VANNIVQFADLREDKHYLSDHPGLVPVTTVQVQYLLHVK